MYQNLTDAQWAILKPLLPSSKPTGRPRANDRQTFNVICYVLRTGCRWHDLSAKYGSPATCHRRLSHWMRDGTWLRLWEALLVMLSRQDKLRLEQTMLDASLVPAKKGGLVSARPNEARVQSGWFWSMARVLRWEHTWTRRPRWRSGFSTKRRSTRSR